MPTMYVREIAAATLANGGAAFHLDTLQFLPPLDIWSFPKYPGKTIILPSDINLEQALKNYIATNTASLREPNCWLGTWIHPETREFYLDITTGCSDLKVAKRLALEASRRDGRKIVAIYNSKLKQTIYL